MGQDILLLLIIFVLIIVFLYQISANAKKRERYLKNTWKEAWGTASEKEYDRTKYESISHYFQQQLRKGKITEPYVDDITWNDLDLDEVYQVMDHTTSLVGAEYLYYLLRTPVLSAEKLKERDRLMEFFTKNEEERLRLQYLFYEIGGMPKYSVSDYIDRLEDVRREKNSRHYLAIAAIAVGVGALLAAPRVGMILLIAAAVWNIKSYFVRKSEIEPYIATFSYLIRVLRAAEALGKEKIPEIQFYLDKLHKIREEMNVFLKHSHVLVAGRGATGSMVDAVLDYIRMLFHIDLIKFNSMLEMAEKNRGKIEEVIQIIGYLDSMISAASFRTFLPYYEKPNFTEGKKAEIYLENVYHPLLADPVANSVIAHRGILLTGSNASGKSTFLKTVAINTVLAQTIFTCPAAKYEAPFFQIYSSMALRDNLQGNESYYIVEIKSLKRILNHVNEDVPMLCFVDEVLRGTNTVERIAASAQILKSLAKEGVICFAATHDIELTHLLENCYDNYHFQETIMDEDILFDYCLQKGRAVSRNAIKLLRLIGYEDRITDEAEKMAEEFLATGNWTRQEERICM